MSDLKITVLINVLFKAKNNWKFLTFNFDADVLFCTMLAGIPIQIEQESTRAPICWDSPQLITSSKNHKNQGFTCKILCN